jgi:hypothetical protein
VDRSASPQPEETYVSSSRKDVEVAAGAVVQGVELRLKKARTFHIRGHISAAQAGRHTYALFLLAHGGAQSSMQRQVDAKGDFDMPNVLPGRYTVQAGYSGDGTYRATNVDLEVRDANIENLAVNIGPPLTVTGRLAAEGGAPDLSRVLVTLQLRDSGSVAMLSSNSKAAADGAFKLADLSPGRYDLLIEGLPDGWYADPPADGVAVASGAPAAIEVKLTAGTGTVSGTVAGAPAAGVVLLPEDTKKWTAMAKVVTADASGAFTIAGVAPGAYRAYAWKSLDNVGYLDPEYMKSLEAKGAAITIRDSEAKTVRLGAM